MNEQKEELDLDEVRRKRIARFDIRQAHVPTTSDNAKPEENKKESKTANGAVNPHKQKLSPCGSKGVAKVRKLEKPKSSATAKPEGSKRELKIAEPQKPASDPEVVEGFSLYGKTYKTQLPDTRMGYLIRKAIPGDDSCLFTSIGFLVSGLVDSGFFSPLLRKVVADTIVKQSHKYTEQVLNRTQESYCEWILQSSSWGGGVEMTILSEHFDIEIAIINCVAGVVTIFGNEREQQRRGYLLYDGSHYDALYLSLIGTEDEFMGVFPPDANEIFATADQIAHDISVSPTFAFLKRDDKCIFTCQDCGQENMDRFGMMQHAINMVHKNYDLIEGDLDFLQP